MQRTVNGTATLYVLTNANYLVAQLRFKRVTCGSLVHWISHVVRKFKGEVSPIFNVTLNRQKNINFVTMETLK